MKHELETILYNLIAAGAVASEAARSYAAQRQELDPTEEAAIKSLRAVETEIGATRFRVERIIETMEGY